MRNEKFLTSHFSPLSSYLITGGLGGLGLKVAAWLAAQGARHLVLAGRRGVESESTQRAISELEELGAQVLVVQADISQAVDVSRLITTCQNFAPLKGIIHAAGVIDDGIILQQTADRFAKVFAPKVWGCWHLHQASQNIPLDFFVSFSSVTSLLGNGGQANYAAANAFMDGLMAQRRVQGLPGLSINWGGWAEVGLAEREKAKGREKIEDWIAPQQGVALLGYLLSQNTTQVGVIPVNWTKFGKQLPVGSHFPVLSHFLKPKTITSSKNSLRQQLAQAATIEEQLLLLKQHLRTEIETILGVASTDEQSFFDLGMDSLMSIQVSNRLATYFNVSLPTAISLQYPTIEQLATQLLNIVNKANDITMPDKVTAALMMTHNDYPQLYNQQECYIWHEQAANKACMQLYLPIHIQSPVNVTALQKALNALIERHESLQMTFSQQQGALRQQIKPGQTADFKQVELECNTWLEVAPMILSSAQQLFDLAQGPLLRGHLFSRAINEHVLLIVTHHIAVDATSFAILLTEFWPLYQFYDHDQPLTLPPITTTFTNFITWQSSMLAGLEGQRLKTYWHKQLAGQLYPLHLPTDYPRRQVERHYGACYTVQFEAELIQPLRQLAQHEGGTLYMVFMTAFQLFLHHYTKQNDILVSMNVSNRTQPDFAHIVGYLSDILPIRIKIVDQEITWRELLQQVRLTILEAINHQGYPIKLLAQELNLPSEPSRPTLSPIWFTMLPHHLFQETAALLQPGPEAIQQGDLRLTGLDIIPAWLGNWYELELNLIEYPDMITGMLVYSSDLFTEATVAQWVAHLRQLLKLIAADPTQPISKLSFSQ